ncbi:MAG: 4Fe-4S cluster-binding domain-containing protein [Clostridiales bacterium]|nr:4Fe-4S cluster-binding domain-containing protein [Clostridiales bacterium]
MCDKKYCDICPRKCKAERNESDGSGFCGEGMLPKVARAGLHMWEEPCISGERGSGAVFFSGCNLGCVYCQNSDISSGHFGKTVSVERLRKIFFELIEKGAHNINLVTPTHFADTITEALDPVLPVPVVWNCGGYESIETLKKLDGKIQIYLPDMKYSLSEASKKYSFAPDYPDVSKRAVLEMYRQTGDVEFDSDGMLKKGVIIRHLVLPGNLENTFGVIDFVKENFKKGSVLFSLMSQYFPAGRASEYPELSRRLTEEEYSKAEEYLFDAGIDDGFVQELSSAAEEYVPPFDLTGV